VSTADIYTAALSKTSVQQAEPFDRVSSIAEDDEFAALFAPSTDRELADATPQVQAHVQGSASLWGGSSDDSQAMTPAASGFDDLADLGIEPFSFDGMPDLLPDVDDPVSFAPRRDPASPAPAHQPVAESHAAPAPAATIPDVAAAPEPRAPPVTAPPVFVGPFVDADCRVDLTAGWDDLDRSLAAATPSFEAAGRYDDLSAEIDLDGIVPFDADIPVEDEDAWAPMTEDDFGIEPVAAADVAEAPPVMDVSLDAVSEQAPAPVTDWSMDDVGMGLEDSPALDALMALPTIDDLAANPRRSPRRTPRSPSPPRPAS